MALDGITLHFLKEELSQKLIGSKVEKIYQPSKCELVFLMRTRAGAFRLYMSAQAISPRINISELSYENPQKPPMLCMLLRKRLTGAVLTDITQISLDRILCLDFDATNEIGDRVNLKLYVEIMAQRSNLILVDSDGRIIDAVKRVDETKSTFREILPQGTYLLPPSQNKLNIITDSCESIVEAVRANKNQLLSKSLLSVILGISPVVARELAYRSAGDDIMCGLMTKYDCKQLALALEEIRQRISDGNPLPQVVMDEEGNPLDFSFFDITQYADRLEIVKYACFSELLDAFSAEKERSYRIRRRAGDLLKLLSNTHDRIARKVSLQRLQLEKCADKDELRIMAELINSNLYRLEKGSAYYDIENYYDNNNILRIPADPALTPAQNAQRYYKEYRKTVTAEKMLDELIESGEQELVYIDSVLDCLSRADSEAEITEIRQELIEGGYIRKRAKDKVKSPKLLPPYEFTTSDGFKVLVGRNNMQNDRLSLKIAKNYDMWLHTQGFVGSHTIIVSDNREISDTAIVEAARIAAHFSSASEAKKVPVDYTLVRNLRKPKNAKPGKVIYNTYSTVYVEPAKDTEMQVVL